MQQFFINARLYRAFNPFMHYPEAGLPALQSQDLPVEIQFGTSLADHKIIFTLGGNQYTIGYRKHSVSVDPNEIQLEYRCSVTDADGNQLPIELSKLFPSLAKLGNNDLLRYDPVQLRMNTFSEFEHMRQAVTNGEAILTEGEFIGRRAINGILHALGFWMQFPFDAATGKIQQPLVCSSTVTNESAADAADGIITINVEQGSVAGIETSLDGGASWTNTLNYEGLASGAYPILVRQSNRPNVPQLINAVVGTDGAAA